MADENMYRQWLFFDRGRPWGGFAWVEKAIAPGKTIDRGKLLALELR
jgi:hypothetical protein